MRLRKLLVAAACAAATVTIASAGAATGPRAATGSTAHAVRAAAPRVVRVTTRAAAVRYLAARGIDARGLVIQHGARNYAGPRCPGSGWSCTTAKRVLQVGSQNKVECEGGTVTGSSCTIIQAGQVNHASCKERTSAEPAAQVCVITQTGARNDARVDQRIDQDAGPAQRASQLATVMQTASEKNYLQVYQAANQDTGGTQTQDGNQDTGGTQSQVGNQDPKTGGTQTQDAFQRADVTQVATGSGDNVAHVKQDQHQTAFGGQTQQQNATPSSEANCSPIVPANPNACTNVSQTSDAGVNRLNLDQSLDDSAKTQAVATQQQGSGSGGLEGKVHQATTTGRSVNDADQSKKLELKAAAGSSQRQRDPASCCGIDSQTGGTNNKETIDESSFEKASEPLAVQSINLLGMSRSPTGACTISHDARTNTGNTHQAFTLDPCPTLVVITACAGGGEVAGTCTTAPTTVCPEGSFLSPTTGKCVIAPTDVALGALFPGPAAVTNGNILFGSSLVRLLARRSP